MSDFIWPFRFSPLYVEIIVAKLHVERHSADFFWREFFAFCVVNTNAQRRLRTKVAVLRAFDADSADLSQPYAQLERLADDTRIVDGDLQHLRLAIARAAGALKRTKLDRCGVRLGCFYLQESR